ncbi:MAG: ABC transporter substrate-binding protein [Dehalococcoidia bacterium]|nr:ABC transporter substrate-binding protein [Dehalococcoidia bacterium]
MSDSNYWTRIGGNRVSRRAALRGAGIGAAGIAGAALIGCGGDDNGATATAAPGGGGGTATATATEDAGAARQGGSYTTQTSTFAGVDPHNSVYGGAGIVPIVYNYLIRQEVLRQDLGELGQITDLAESVEVSGDQQTWVFKLRPGVKIAPNSQGVPERDLNSADVIASFDRIADADNGANGYATFALFVESYEAPDDNTVQVVTRSPFSWLLEALGDNLQGAIVPQEWLDKGSDAVKAGAVGAGPFILESLVEGDKAVMKRNPNYYKEGQPYLDEVRILIMPDTATRITAFRDRQIDVHVTENGEEAASLVADGITHVEHGSTGYNSFWMRTDTPPYDDPRVRRAINMSMNRDQYIAIIGRGQGAPMGPLAPVFENYALTADELAEAQPYDPQAAKALFEEAGVSEIQFAHPTSANMNDYVNILQQQLQQIGISIRPTPLDAGTWVAGYFAGAHEASFSFNQSYKTPHFALQWHRTGGITGNMNYDTKYYTPEVDAAIDNAAAIFDEEERRAAYKEAQRVILDSDPAFLNVFNVANNTLYYSDIHRTQPGPGALDGSLLQEWWIEA